MRVIDIGKYLKDKPPLWYAYPQHHVVSFRIVAEEHIKQLSKAFWG